MARDIELVKAELADAIQDQASILRELSQAYANSADKFDSMLAEMTKGEKPKFSVEEALQLRNDITVAELKLREISTKTLRLLMEEVV